MARIRTIKPEIWTSEQFVECSTSARLLFIGLWSFCDDQGVHPASLKRLKMEVFPGDDFSQDDMRGWMGELQQAGLVVSFESEGGLFWFVTGWRHQKIDRPSVKYPKPPSREELATSVRRVFDECSTNTSRVDDPGREGKGRVREEEEKKEEPNGSSCQNGRSPREVYELIRDGLKSRGLPCPRKLTEERRRKLRTRLTEEGWVEELEQALKLLPLPGDGQWQPDFDWLVLDNTNVQRVLEKRYDWRGKDGKPKQRDMSVEAMWGKKSE